MKIVGIICEYNPFHLGHLRQFRLIREALGEDTRIICVMSGNYVQRGTPAVLSKFDRARAAVACGADVVLELPITRVLRSAEGFADGGVEILHRFGCVDHLCFGTESADADTLTTIAKKIDSPEYLQRLHEALDQGLPYAAARQAALGDDSDLLMQPNNILGLEYCRALLRRGCTMIPMTVQRNGGYHDTTANESAPSATAVRALFPDDNWAPFVPDAAADCFRGAPWYDLSFGERAMLARLRALDDDQWAKCAHGSEGLWSKAMKAARSEDTVEAILDATKSKRYPRTRIQRLLLCAYLGIIEQDLQSPFPYVRVLAISASGGALLRQAKAANALPLINAGETPSDSIFYRLECRSSDLYTLFSANHTGFPCKTEQNGRIIKLSNFF